MAQQVEQIPPFEDGFFAHGAQKYPWHRWLNGSIWRITEDEWECKSGHHFIQTARSWARRRGGNVQARVVERGGKEVVFIQYFQAWQHRNLEADPSWHGQSPTSPAKVEEMKTSSDSEGGEL